MNYRNGSDQDSGHVATVRRAPIRATDLDDAGRPAWMVQVVDSTDTPHGTPSGTDYARYPDTRWYSATAHATGAGYGYLVLYADATGRFAGYRWSPSDAEFHDSHDRPLVAARISA